MSATDWRIGQALDSYNSLCNVIGVLTEDELHKVLEIETSTRRRTSIIRRLISRLARINELRYVKELKSKYKCENLA